MINNLSDQVIEARNGDIVKNSFDLYYNRLVYFAFQIINDKSQAEDLVQDAFVKLWNSTTLVSDHPIAVKNFLYSTVKNAAFNLIRHNKVTEKHINSLLETPVEEAVFHSIIRAEVLGEIHKAIAKLPVSCQQIFKMCYLDEMKNNQIADLLGISVNTVKTQKQRALKVLRGQLSPELFSILVAAIIWH